MPITPLRNNLWDLPLHKTNVGYMIVFAIIPIILIIMGGLISSGLFHKPKHRTIETIRKQSAGFFSSDIK
jgi:hypothetical protein